MFRRLSQILALTLIPVPVWDCGSHGGSVLISRRTAMLFPTVAFIPLLSAVRFSPLPTFLLILSFVFYDSHPSRHEVVSHCDFDLHFPGD